MRVPAPVLVSPPPVEEGSSVNRLLMVTLNPLLSKTRPPDWITGVVVIGMKSVLEAIACHMPALSEALDRLSFSADVWELANLKHQIEEIYREIAGESIDFGVMERAENVQVVPAGFGWSDVGSWSALPEVIDGDASGTVAINTREVVAVDARECLVYGDGRLVALVGVEGLVVVNTPDALLVCPRERAQEVKKVVEELQQRGLKEYL